MYNSGIMGTGKWHFAASTLVLVLALAPVAVRAQDSVAPAPSDIPIDEVIRRFAEKEKEFKKARDNYTFKQEVRVQELSDSDRVMGEYRTTTEIAFDEKGRRTERITYAPASTLKKISITREDLQDLESVQPFVLTSDDIGLYNLKYGGKEKIDEINCYVFDVSPKKIEKDQRYFEGKIWVDDKDLQIVKTYGKAVPDKKDKNGENLFPKFETYREQIDGEYWFPTYTRMLDTLDFSTGRQKIRGIVRYGDYKKFQTSVKLRFGGEVTDDKAAPADNKNAAPALDPKYKTEPKTEPNKK
jgi:hypothetical protein